MQEYERLLLSPSGDRDWLLIEEGVDLARGRLLRLHLEAEPRCIEVAVETGNELALAVLGGPACLARAGQRYVVRAKRSEWGKWQEVSR